MADEQEVAEATEDTGAEQQEQVTEQEAEEAVVESKWPDDWRKQFAGDDDKALKQLDRYQTPADIFKSLRAAQQKISSGEYKKADLPKDATEEQVAEWRKEQGIPEKAEGYLENLPDGLVIGDDDKVLVEGFIGDMHAENAPPGIVHKAIDWYYRNQEQALASQQEADTAFKASAEDELRSDWGNEYRANLSSAMSLLDTMPTLEDGTAVKDLFMKGRLADGTPIGNHPGVLRWLVNMASESGHSGFIAPSDGASRAESVDSEISSIEKTMREKPREYYGDEKMQARYRTLLTAREKLKASA